jgi:3-deoxy-D-manno-octulosonate 8-phosphate phosphatase (KDO 8-P phosphatase)
MNFKEMLVNVKAMIFDVDGVLSQSIIHIDESGELTRTTNIKDGYILKYAIKKGYIIGIISGGLSNSVRIRFQDLGIEDVILGSKRKIIDFESFLHKHKLNPQDVLYMGDDIPDYEVMLQAGLPCCPKDAASEIKEISIYISGFDGGKACVRDIVEQVLRANGHWMDDEAFET